MNEYRKVIHDYIQSNRDNIVSDLMDLVRIPSVDGTPEPGAPYGKECARMLKYIEKIHKDNGFECELDEDGGYLLTYYGEGEKSIGLFAHSDVVPVNDDWIYTKPFEPIEKDGFLIGRGISDNKSGVVTSLYIAKMLRDLEIPFNSRLMLFTGSNEECGMDDLKNCNKRHKAPDFAIVPDSGYPVYRGDKGILRVWASASKKLETVTEFEGGSAFNIILGHVEMKLKYSDALYAELTEKAGENITVSKDGDSILLSSNGLSRHAATPEGSINAGLLLAELLCDCGSLPASDREQFETVKSMLGCIYGEYFGIENIDPDFGALTCVNGMIALDDGKLRISFDIRRGSCVDVDEMLAQIKRVLDGIGWGMEVVDCTPAFAVPKDDPYLKALLNVYRDFTGNNEAESVLHAGGTYAMYLPYALEIGTSHGGGTVPFEMPDGHGRAHQPDEYISINGLLESIEIAALMLIEADNM